MSLMTKVDALKAKAEQDGANELDLMRAALVESQERYNQQAAQISLTENGTLFCDPIKRYHCR